MARGPLFGWPAISAPTSFHTTLLICIATFLVLPVAGHASDQPSAPATAPSAIASSPERIEIVGVQNAFRVASQVFSGSQPEGEAAFAALAKLGVRTIISVDGSKPDPDAARRHGMRYVHLPFGYDQVPTNRIAELAKAAASASNGIFVHCHHGLHRGPAAVAVMCQATRDWTTNQALAWLRQAGTAPDYKGLYHSIASFQKLSPRQVEAVSELPEVAKTSSLVESMVLIDEHFSRLKLCQEAGWKTPPHHVDISPGHEALMLLEQFQEMARTDDTLRRSEDYRQKVTDAQAASQALKQNLLRMHTRSADDAFGRLRASCAACHKVYRN